MQKNVTPQNEVTFDNMPKAVAKMYDEVSLIRTQLEELTQKFEPKTPTEFLTRGEIAKMFDCDISTVHNWTVKGKLKPYGMGNRVYYKRHEVEAALTPLSKD